MTRNGVKLAYISNDAAKNVTYKKRKKGLVKKMSELSTLCGVEACAIIYPSTCNSHPKVWPSAVTTHRMLSHFKMLSVVERSNRTMAQERLVRQRIAHADEKVKKLCENNHRKEITQVNLDRVPKSHIPPWLETESNLPNQGVVFDEDKSGGWT
ncbi:hypothetical protein V6N13_030700 [Hibiscus sabdariffa]|uniref:MADS-box domain-containing protein n=1 Tax=Hibiscus sabdariffa TaxID=183260 RepID=A0ABR2D6U1_9ROSI